MTTLLPQILPLVGMITLDQKHFSPSLTSVDKLFQAAPDVPILTLSKAETEQKPGKRYSTALRITCSRRKPMATG